MSLEIARQIVQLIQQDKEFEIRETLDPYSLEHRRYIMSIQHKHSSLLFRAVAKGCVSIVTYFLEDCGADPNSFGWKLVHLEKFGWRNVVKLCCLVMAIDVNSETIVRILLTHGANTEVVSSYGRTPLFHESSPLERACGAYRGNIIRLLIERGANVNSRNYSGETPLFKLLTNNLVYYGRIFLMWYSENHEYKKIIYFLLSCENIDVRVRNNYGEDALHLAVRHRSEDILKRIVSKGVYSKDEIIEVYEMECCLSRVENRRYKARRLWEEALTLRSQPSDTPMFGNQHPAGKLQKLVHILNDDDVPPLLYLESVKGLNNVFTLNVYIRAACNVNDKDKYLTLCEFFLDVMHSCEDKLFFKGIGQSTDLIKHQYGIFYSGDRDPVNLSKMFRLFVPFIEEIRFRLKHMTPQERMPRANQVEHLVECIINMVSMIDGGEKMNLFHEGIKRILRTGLPALPLTSLLLSCQYPQHIDCIIKCFIRCGADVNSTDKEGKTALHEVVESEITSREKIVKVLLKNGFDFSRVRCDEYCLPCRLESENLIPRPVKYISLQCLAARTLCEKTMNCFSDVPRYVRSIVNSHLFLYK